MTKVLVVEDDKMISQMYSVKLKQEGYEVLTAENGSAAIEQAVEHHPDIILLDIILPQLDGFSVLQELRLNKAFKETPIIMLTNLGTTDDIEKGKQMGATDYLVKANLTPGQVCEKIKEYLA